jgi:peptidyl-prolyl cis-trans isomerase D
MALISKIRNNSWLLVVLIGLGLLGFIIMDMTSGQQSVFGSSQFTLAKIEGEKLDWNHFLRVEQTLYSGSAGDTYGRRQYLWDFFVEEVLVQKEAEALGLGVSKTELLDLQFGPNPSNIIRQRFADPNTGQINFQQLNEIRRAIEDGTFTDPSMRSFWAQQEKEIIKERLQSKLSNMIAKAIYTPTWMVEMGNAEQNQRLDLAYVKIPFDEIDNSEVSLSDEDFKAYLQENRARYHQDEETRKIEYVVFDVFPSAEDSARVRTRIAELIPDFEAAENDSAFVELNYGQITASYLSKDELSPAVADTIFTIPVGSVYGPYIDGSNYNAMKVLARETISDSADTRHILLQASTPADFERAKKTIDSLENLLLARTVSFDTLAARFSQDPGSANNGGKYENVRLNQFVPEFNEVLFVTGQIGRLYKVRTSFGWHLLEVLKRSASRTERVQIAMIGDNIEPSDETQNEAYDQVMSFIGQNRKLEQLRQSVAAVDGLELEVSRGLKKNDFQVGVLGAGQGARDMVRWAFNAKAGEVSPEAYTFQDPESYFTNKYVVAALRSIQKPGLPSLDNIRDEIEPLVLNKKKGELIQQRIQSTDLDAIAAQFNTEVDTARSVTFGATFIPGLGAEPALIGEVFLLEPGQTTKPVIGQAGVFVAKVLDKPALAAANNIPQLRTSIALPVRNQVTNQLIQAMKKNAEIDDFRSRFY